MQYITLNLECNQMPLDDRIFTEKSLSEIIEIGAVKINEDFDIVDTFKVYVKPSIYKYLSNRIIEKTDISKNDLEDGFDFNKTIEGLKKWIGEEDSVLCLWANDGIKILYQSFDFFKTKITLQDLFTDFLDVQLETAKYFKLWNQPSQALAVEKLEILIENDISSKVYDSLDKAYCTAHVLKALNKKDVVFEIIELDSLKQNGFSSYRNFEYDEDTKIKHEKEELRLIIKCPICETELSREYTWRNGNKIKYLSTCENCGNKVLHFSK